MKQREIREGAMRAVIFQSGEWWVGQILDQDIATQAKTKPDPLYELGRTLAGRMLRSEGLPQAAVLPGAPRRFWDMFASGTDVPFEVGVWKDRDGRIISIPNLEVREAEMEIGRPEGGNA